MRAKGLAGARLLGANADLEKEILLNLAQRARAELGDADIETQHKFIISLEREGVNSTRARDILAKLTSRRAHGECLLGGHGLAGYGLMHLAEACQMSPSWQCFSINAQLGAVRIRTIVISGTFRQGASLFYAHLAPALVSCVISPRSSPPESAGFHLVVGYRLLSILAKAPSGEHPFRWRY